MQDEAKGNLLCLWGFLVLAADFLLALPPGDAQQSIDQPVYNILIKVQGFREGHKNVRNLTHDFDIYLVNVKTIKEITQIFVASQKLNFKKRKVRQSRL